MGHRCTRPAGTGRRRGPFLALLVLLVLALWFAPLPWPEHSVFAARTAAPADLRAQDVPAAPPAVTARGVVLWDPADEKVLHGVAETVGRPMASLTKVMTVLLALEAGALEDDLVVSPTAVGTGGASLELVVGQVIPVRSILAGLILRSGNDAAVALAEHLAGSEQAFVERMNARAREMGLDDTFFVNASGLTDDPRHRASPLDLARLTQVAMSDPDFAALAGTAQLTVPGLAPMVTRNELLLGRYPGATGVKTGFTELAGLCLVATAARDGRVLYVVVLNSEDSFGDATAMLDYGFDAFARPAPLSAQEVATSYRWSDGAVPLMAAETLTATVPLASTVTWRLVLDPVAQRPVPADEVLGRGELLVDGDVEHAVDLLTAEASLPPGPPEGAAATVGTAVQEAVRTFVRLRPIDRAVSPGLIEGGVGDT